MAIGRKTILVSLYAITLAVVVGYFAIYASEKRCVDSSESLWSTEGNKDQQRAFNFYAHKKSVTNYELCMETSEEHAHGFVYSLWAWTAVVLPLVTLVYSVITLIYGASRATKALIKLAPRDGASSADSPNQGMGAIRSFLNRPVRVKDEIISTLLILLGPKLYRRYFGKTKRGQE